MKMNLDPNPEEKKKNATDDLIQSHDHNQDEDEKSG